MRRYIKFIEHHTISNPFEFLSLSFKAFLYLIAGFTAKVGLSPWQVLISLRTKEEKIQFAVSGGSEALLDDDVVTKRPAGVVMGVPQ